MAGVFISYRRADSQTWADRLADSLILRFGGGLIWRDVDDIPAGEPWPTEIRKALAAADAVLVLIGPGWLEVELNRIGLELEPVPVSPPLSF